MIQKMHCRWLAVWPFLYPISLLVDNAGMYLPRDKLDLVGM